MRADSCTRDGDGLNWQSIKSLRAFSDFTVYAHGQMVLEGQPLLPARPPPNSRRTLLAWLRGVPFVAIALVAVFAVGIGSHIAMSDVAQSVSSSLTQRAAGVSRWGGKPLATLPAQDDAGGEEEEEPEGVQGPERPGAMPSSVDSAGASHTDTGASQQDAAEGNAAGLTPSIDADSSQQSADAVGQAGAAVGDQQQVSGGDAGQQSADSQQAETQPAAGSDQQSSDTAQQQDAAPQTVEPAPATLEEVRICPWQ